MIVAIGWRNRVGSFFSGWTLPVAVVTITGVAPVALYFAPLGLVVTLAGRARLRSSSGWSA